MGEFDRSIYATFYRTYSCAILVIFLIYLGYSFSFFYFVGFGNNIEEVGLIHDLKRNSNQEEILTDKEDRSCYNLIHWAFP